MSRSSNISKEQTVEIVNLFKTMKELSASHNHSSLAKHWLDTHKCLSGFVDGKWISPDASVDNTEVDFGQGLISAVKWASSEEINSVIENSQEGFKRWLQYEAEAKSKVLFRISQYIEQQSKLLNAIENLTKYGRLREKYNTQYLIDSFSYYAGLVGDKDICDGWKPTGVVCITSDGNNLISSLWLLSALLAAGNAVICLVDCRKNISALFLAELCDSAGLPAGVFNVIACENSLFPKLASVDKIILSSPRPQLYLSGTLNKNIPFDVIPHQSPCVIVYESADLDAATSSLLEVMHIFDTLKPWPMFKIYLQESIQKKFIKLLMLKVCGCLGGNANDRPSFFFMGNEITVVQVQEMLLNYSSDDSTKGIFDVCKSSIKEEDQYVSSAVMTFNAQTDQDQTIRCGPGIYLELFRTVKESIAMFNLSKKNSEVSIWSEEIYLGLEVASKLKSRTVWVNCLNIYEPSVTSGSLFLNGSSNIGGREGFYSQLSCLESDRSEKNVDANSIKTYGSVAPSPSIIPLKSSDGKKIEKCFKLYIGGAFVNSCGETFQRAVNVNNDPYAYVASANKFDVDKAVASASSAQPKWENMLKIKRCGIFRKASELLSKRKDEFVSELCTVTGSTKEFCTQEVEQTISVLFYWANYISHFDGRMVETKLNGKVFQDYNPLGVIGIQCPDKEPLLSFIYLITPAIVFGNAVVAISSEKYPTCALKMCEIFQSAGLLGGVLNVIASSRPYLTRHLSSHLNIDSIWFAEDGEDFIYDSYLSIQPKKIFNCKNMPNTIEKWTRKKFLLESTYTKAVFVPMGTGFA